MRICAHSYVLANYRRSSLTPARRLARGGDSRTSCAPPHLYVHVHQMRTHRGGRPVVEPELCPDGARHPPRREASSSREPARERSQPTALSREPTRERQRGRRHFWWDSV